MQVRTVIFSILVFAAAQLSCAAGKDHLQRGEPRLKYDHEIRYDGLVRKILGRGWQSDVVLRTVVLPPFDPEAVVGLLRSGGIYRAFVVRPSSQIWEGSNLGLSLGHPKQSLKNVRPIYHSRVIADAVAIRIAAIYRRVLTDRRNYSTDPNLYVDTSQTTFYLAFARDESLTANMAGWGPHTEHILWLNEALMDYARGEKSDAELTAEVTKRESKLGI